MNHPVDLCGLTREAFGNAVAPDRGTSTAPGALYRAAFAQGRFPPAGTDAQDPRGDPAPPVPGLPPRVRTLQSAQRPLPPSVRALARSLADRFVMRLPEILHVDEEEGEYGRTAKALLRFPDGAQVECVRIPVPSRGKRERIPRATLCLSSQAGCRMGCAFCETGSGGFVRNLDAGEIVSQHIVTRTRLGWEVGAIVFMGMGEPLDNLPAVSGALDVLFDPSGPGFSREAVTICTAGLPEGIAGLRALGHRRLNLSVSLNAPDDRTRAELMPIARTHDLAGLARALRAYPMRRSFVLGVNYCLIPGRNDGPEAARGIADFVAAAAVDGRALVNIIPYNPGTKPLGSAPSQEKIEDFRSRLAALGLHVRLRVPRGRTLMAACGQLGSASAGRQP